MRRTSSISAIGSSRADTVGCLDTATKSKSPGSHPGLVACQLVRCLSNSVLTIADDGSWVERSAGCRVPHVSWFSRRGILTAPETNSEKLGQKRGKRGDGNVARGQATGGTHPSFFRSTGLPTSQKIGERPVCPHISAEPLGTWVLPMLRTPRWGISRCRRSKRRFSPWPIFRAIQR